MSITLFTTRYLGGDNKLFRDDSITIKPIPRNSDLYNYLYDEEKSRLRISGEDLQLYQLKGQPIYAIKCINNNYEQFETPNKDGKSEYISILVKLLLGCSSDGDDKRSLNIILHQKDINIDAFNIAEYAIDDITENCCYWINSDNIKKHLLTDRVVEELNNKGYTISIALFSHVISCPLSRILKKDKITPAAIDDIIAKKIGANDADLENNDAAHPHFPIPEPFRVVDKEWRGILGPKKKTSEDFVTIEWSEKEVVFHVRIVTYGSSYICFNKHHPEGDTMYYQEKYSDLQDDESSFIPTIHVFDDKISEDKHPRFYDFTDGSIWNYRCSFGNQERLVEILKAIAINTKNDLYKLSISYEYADLNARLLENSYVATCGYGGHEIISPFLFHSEQTMKKKLENWGSLQHNWRFLLVDDHAVKDLGYAKTHNTTPIGKSHIIAECFNNASLSTNIECFDMNSDDSSKKPFYSVLCQNKTYGRNYIKIDCVTSIDRAFKLVTSSRYDLILLDYKLGEKCEGNAIEFGYELLERIHDKHEELTNNGKIGPAGRFYFMFISAYTTAVSQRFLKEGYRISTKYWFIDKGACPTNTPYLFLYSLKRLMDKRYESLIKHGKNLITALKIDSSNKPIITVIDFLNTLYSPEEEKTVRERCKNGFNAFLLLRSTYDIIKYDVWDGKIHKKKDLERDEKFVASEENESKLVHSIFPDVICYNNTFWEHMQHLVYLSAYGTNRQWPEMWEELQSVSDILNNAEIEIAKYVTKNNPPDNNTTHTIVRLIRNYILDLKHKNSR